jgi:hypothetical protein
MHVRGEDSQGMTRKNGAAPLTRHPQREGPRPLHFHLIWPVSGLTIQASKRSEELGVVPSHANAQWY